MSLGGALTVGHRKRVHNRLRLPFFRAPLQQRVVDLPLGSMPQNESSGVGLNIFDSQHWGNDFIASHRIMPFHLFDEQSIGVGCTRIYQESRGLLAQGASPAIVLGGPVLNVNTLFPSGSSHTSHRLSTWAVDFTRDFPAEPWSLRVATAYLVFHVMRVSTLPEFQAIMRIRLTLTSSHSGLSIPRLRVLHLFLILPSRLFSNSGSLTHSG